MFVLGVDPGVSRCGYGCVARRESGEIWAVAAGVVETSRELALPSRLAGLGVELRALIEELRPDVVAVERVFFQSNALTAMSTGQASGLALAAAAEAGCEVVQYTANEVKQAVTGYGAASKSQVQEMVSTLLSLRRGQLTRDAADALALGLCHLRLVSWKLKVDGAIAGTGEPDARASRRSPVGSKGVVV